ncbi:MAG: T9SS type A sorting domain-containing protein, partial [Flavobacterium sp.]
GWYKVFATADFTGDPMTTQWTELTGLDLNVPTAWQFIPSGQLTIPDGVKSASSRIAFRYISSAAASATWEIKNIRVTGYPQGTSPNAGLFKITNWNAEWLGCTSFGPSDDSLQMANVVAAMLEMNSDIYCLQEVANSTSSPSIATMVSLLGSDVWDGQIVPTSTGDCDQRQAIIYKKARVQVVSSALLSNGGDAQGNSYYYNWSSGRYPAVYNVNLISGSAIVPLSIVNIHAKAEDGNPMSYTRRLGGSQALKTILDGPAYNTKKVLLIGDFNDYLEGTSSTACSCTVSPYDNFMSDTANYSGITQNLSDAVFGHPVIENVIVSSELAGDYIAGSAAQEISVTQSISNYFGTTSDHLPESTMFQFALLGTPDFTLSAQNSLAVYPNPVKDQLSFDNNTGGGATIAVYDVMGREIRFEKVNSNTIGVSQLPGGTYILKVGTRFGRFVKQ